jgi:hypothetical protein
MYIICPNFNHILKIPIICQDKRYKKVFFCNKYGKNKPDLFSYIYERHIIGSGNYLILLFTFNKA